MPRPFIRRCAAVLVLGSATLPLLAPARAVAQPVVREQHTLTIGGAKETWQLVWQAKPSTVCGPDEVYISITCPCAGWAYAEYGKLSLVRRRGGRDIDHMDLATLFDKSDAPEEKAAGSAYLQRWPLKLSDADRENSGDTKLVAEIKRRPAPQIMTFANYDGAGAATEFLLQVGTLPCGKLQFAAIGVTTKTPHLHALTSAAHPDSPLILPLAAWQALQHGAGQTAVTTWPCGDHGSETRTELIVSANAGTIRVKQRDYSCPAKGQQEKLLTETGE